jgi:hypothetical protein
MTEFYRFYFGSNKGKRYLQALELAELAYKHEVIEKEANTLHIVTFTSDQLDLMALLYKIRPATPYFMIKENYQVWQNDMLKVNQKLREEGYLKNVDRVTGRITPAWKKSQERVLQYKEIRELISRGEYEKAVKKYYEHLGKKYYGELHNELIYLKRIANLPLEARDLLYFKTESSRSDLIRTNIPEYVDCISCVLQKRQSAEMKSPLEILIEDAPTMEQLIKKREDDWHNGIRLMPGEWKRNNDPVTINSFNVQDDKCLEGRFFDVYPDQVQQCRIIEYPKEGGFNKLWTIFSPAFYKENILAKGLHLTGIQVYRHKSWEWEDREPDFASLTSMSEMIPKDYGAYDIQYTGRSHIIEGKTYYEVDLLRRNYNYYKEIVNPFIELVEEILREAENLLRENHGLPRIGEGWLAEMELYNLVKQLYPDATHHISPSWLRPQHLDVFVPSKNMAFEYQGQQHFEPIDFFGGDEAHKRLQELDARKAKKCKSNKVILIYWRYDESIVPEILTKKLENIKRNKVKQYNP